MKILHCRAKVKVRVRTGGENRTAPATAQRQRRTVRAGGGPFAHGGRDCPTTFPVSKKTMMKKTVLAVVSLAAAAWSGNAQIVQSFDDIEYWVGEGTKRAALVIQWNDDISPGALAWGYRWSGNATGLDMINAIAGTTAITDPFEEPLGSLTGADGRLVAGVVRYSFGDSIFSLEYSGAMPARTRADWFSGYWQYLIFGGNFEYTDWGATEPSLYNTSGSPLYASVSWFTSPIGMGDRVLVDGAWDALSFAPGFAGRSVVQPAAVPVPEPTALGLVGLGGLLLIHARRRIFAR